MLSGGNFGYGHGRKAYAQPSGKVRLFKVVA